MADHSAHDRIQTGISGLDTILSGGLLRGSTLLIQGAPGSGKTILANQIAFTQAVQRRINVLYVTLLAESHTRLLKHLGSLQFFNQGAIGDQILYLSGYRALRESVNALLTLLRAELVARRPSLLIVDGIAAVQELHGTASCRQFMHEVQVSTETANCTGLLISANHSSPTPEVAVVDSALFLAERQIGARTIRELQVCKSRGTPHLPGRHSFVINDRGMTVFPRIDAIYRTPAEGTRESGSRITFDVPTLDDMLGGGLPAGSSTLLLGATGTGKTLFGLSFLAAGLKHGGTAVYSGFYETPDRLIASGDGVGLGLRAQVKAGRLHVDRQAPIELLIDAWADRVLQLVRDHRPQRLFIDGLNAIQEGAVYPDRLSPFLTALSNQLSALGVTTAIAGEMHAILGSGVDVPLSGISPLVENTILLRYVEHRSRLARLIAVLKVRGSGHDTLVREFAITSAGIRFAARTPTRRNTAGTTRATRSHRH